MILHSEILVPGDHFTKQARGSMLSSVNLTVNKFFLEMERVERPRLLLLSVLVVCILTYCALGDGTIRVLSSQVTVGSLALFGRLQWGGKIALSGFIVVYLRRGDGAWGPASKGNLKMIYFILKLALFHYICITNYYAHYMLTLLCGNLS